MSEPAFNPLIAGIEEIRRSWGWFLALGILLIILGMACIAFDVAATFTTVLIFGWMLLMLIRYPIVGAETLTLHQGHTRGARETIREEYEQSVAKHRQSLAEQLKTAAAKLEK